MRDQKATSDMRDHPPPRTRPRTAPTHRCTDAPGRPLRVVIPPHTPRGSRLVPLPAASEQRPTARCRTRIWHTILVCSRGVCRLVRRVPRRRPQYDRAKAQHAEHRCLIQIENRSQSPRIENRSQTPQLRIDLSRQCNRIM